MIAYDAALSRLNTADYARAAEEFEAFVVKNPGHPLVPSAIYWRGEAYLAQNDWARARVQFETVISRHRGHDKVPDALYELAVCERRLGHDQGAAVTLQRLLREFPRSDAARRATLLGK